MFVRSRGREESHVVSAWWPLLESEGANLTDHAWLPAYCEHHANYIRNIYGRISFNDVRMMIPAAIRIALLLNNLDKCDFVYENNMPVNRFTTELDLDDAVYIRGLSDRTMDVLKVYESQLISDISDEINDQIAAAIEDDNRATITLGLFVNYAYDDFENESEPKLGFVTSFSVTRSE